MQISMNYEATAIASFSSLEQISESSLFFLNFFLVNRVHINIRITEMAEESRHWSSNWDGVYLEARGMRDGEGEEHRDGRGFWMKILERLQSDLELNLNADLQNEEAITALTNLKSIELGQQVTWVTKKA